MPEPGDAAAPGALSHVFRPVKIGSLELPHRIVMGSMHLGVEGAPDAGARLAAFYRERALGGAGLIVTGGWAVSADGAADGSYGILAADAPRRGRPNPPPPERGRPNPPQPGRGRPKPPIAPVRSTAGGRAPVRTTAAGEAAKRALAEVAAATEGTEAAIALQLFHAGRYALADSPGEVVAPSAVTSRVSRAEPRALGEEEVWDVVAEFAAGARLAQELGFAAVEVMGSEGYLVDQFLSPVTNRREDSWGGDAEGRMRFGIEVALAVREAVGVDFPVLFRMTGAELMPGSRPWEEVEAFAAALVAAGVDALNIGVGWHESPVPTVQGAVPNGAFVPWAEGIKAAISAPARGGDGEGPTPPAQGGGGAGPWGSTQGGDSEATRAAGGEVPSRSQGSGEAARGSTQGGDGEAAITGTAATSAGLGAVPVIAGNRMNGLGQADAVLARGGVDLVSMSRPFLADPRIVEKGRGGGAVNVCISCDQACIDRSLTGGHVSCLVNPRAGYEVEFPADAHKDKPTKSSDRRRFVVIGGGPAGLEAARVLATLGGDVHLYEAREELGGQFRWARMVPGKEDYGATISYFESDLRRLGVHLHLGHEVGEAEADVLADCVGVVLATGVHPRGVDLPGSSLPHVVDYADAFEFGLGDARSVAIVGAGGIGVDLAHLLTHEPSDAADFYERYGVAPPSAASYFDMAEVSNHAADRVAPPGGGPNFDAAQLSNTASAPIPGPTPKVTLMRRSGRVGSGIGVTTRWVWLDALKHAGVETRTGLSYRRITATGIEIEKEDGAVETIAADRVVIAAGQERRDELRPLLERLEIPHRVVGGAENPSELNAVRAFGDGLRAAYDLARPT